MQITVTKNAREAIQDALQGGSESLQLAAEWGMEIEGNRIRGGWEAMSALSWYAGMMAEIEYDAVEFDFSANARLRMWETVRVRIDEIGIVQGELIERPVAPPAPTVQEVADAAINAAYDLIDSFAYDPDEGLAVLSQSGKAWLATTTTRGAREKGLEYEFVEVFSLELPPQGSRPSRVASTVIVGDADGFDFGGEYELVTLL